MGAGELASRPVGPNQGGTKTPIMTAETLSRPPIKTKEEARATINRDRLADRGALDRHLTVAVTMAGIAGPVVHPGISAACGMLLAADYAYFVARRRRTLREYEAGQPILRRPEDFAQCSVAWASAGIPEPSMSDWHEAAGFGDVPEWREGQRYRIAASYYRGGKLLDVGCGDGRFCWRYGACDPSDYIGLDISPDLLATVRERTANRAVTLQSVAEQIPLPDASVDCVVCAECFEHLPDPEQAMREFARVLRPGGRIVIQTPSALRLRNLNPLHILSLFVGYWFPSALMRKVVHENTFNRVFTYHWDFTRQDFSRYAASAGLRIEEIRGATYRFNPAGSLPHRLAAAAMRLPVLHWAGWDLTAVLRKH